MGGGVIIFWLKYIILLNYFMKETKETVRSNNQNNISGRQFIGI